MVELSDLDMSRSRVRLALVGLKVRADVMAAFRRVEAIRHGGWRAEIARAMYELERTKGGNQ